MINKKSIEENIERHEQLNPKIFSEDNKLLPEVRKKLLGIANKFIGELKEDKITFKLLDIELVGSNCSYNYTDNSDIDLHLIADIASLDCPGDLYPLLYSAYRTIFNQRYDFTISNIPVEIFIEMSSTEQPDEPPDETIETLGLRSNGVYSVTKNQWLKQPVAADIPELDERKFEKLYDLWENKYFKILKTSSVEEVKDFIEDLYDLRHEAIATEGEYGYGNQVFKELRALGYLDELKELKNKLISKQLSLE